KPLRRSVACAGNSPAPVPQGFQTASASITDASSSSNSKHPDASHAPSNAAASSNSKTTALMRSSSTASKAQRRWLMRYEPHDYQRHATTFVEDHPQAAILL